MGPPSPLGPLENAIRYALSLPGIASAVIGVASTNELEQAAAAVTEFKPLSEEETRKLTQAGLNLAATGVWKTAYGTPLT